MKFLMKLTKKGFIIFLTEVLVVGFLTFGFNKFVYRFVDEWTWVEYTRFIIVVLGLIALSCIFVEKLEIKLKGRKSTKMLESIRDKIEHLQNQVLQDFFESQMNTTHSNGWKNEVQQIAVNKENSPYSVYREIKSKFDLQGNNIKVTDFDVTALSALIQYDFSEECTLDNNTIRCIKRITMDRNSLSHISNYKDVQLLSSIERTAIDNVKRFLINLENNAWNPAIIRKYLGTGNNDGEVNEIIRFIQNETSQENIALSQIRRYMQDLEIIRENNLKSYVGLSYNLDGKDENEYKQSLDELIDSNIEMSNIGMRIVSEGGYGKTWTLYEIAGKYAQRYLENNGDSSAIPIIIEMGKLFTDCRSIKGTIAQRIFESDEAKVQPFLKNHKIIMLIDAMDEAKVDIQDDVSNEIASLKETCQNITFICASRKSCIDKYPLSIPCYAIQMLDKTQIVEYLSKTLPKDLIDKAKKDWIGENRKKFLDNNSTPFYLSCYVELLCETGDNDLCDTTQLVDKFLNSMINRELRKNGFRSDRATFINFLKELCKLMDTGNGKGSKRYALPENEVIRKISDAVIVEEGQASIKAVGRKLVEMQILSRDEDKMLLSFSHQNYKEHINRKYPLKKYRKFG